jgi:uncharacterized protein YjbI with pentapeptide repeats
VVHSTAQTITAVVTSLTALGALIFTGLSLNTTREQNNVTAQSQYTDRYIKAIEQLDKAGPEHLQGRLGGIYALERLAHDSPRDQPTIVEVLSGFVRTTSPRPQLPSDPLEAVKCPEQLVSADIQAALDVLGRRDTTKDNDTHINLSRTCLGKARLVGVNLSRADLRNADLHDVNFGGVDLSGANLGGADLNHARLNSADLSNADLSRADIRDAWLAEANLHDASLVGADLTRANLLAADLTSAAMDAASLIETDLGVANLSGAFLTFADLSRADLSRADLSRADLSNADLGEARLNGADLAGANLTGAFLIGAQHDAGTVIDRTRTNSETIGQWW